MVRRTISLFAGSLLVASFVLCPVAARPALADEPAAAPSVAELIKQLGSKDQLARYQAVHALADLGPGAKDAVPDLVKALSDADPELRSSAATALAAIGPAAKEAGLALVARLKDEVPDVRSHAAHALGNIGAVNEAVVPELVRTTADEDPNVRRTAVRAIQKIKPGPDVVLPLVEKLLEDKDPSVVLHALQSMAEVGEKAMPTIIGALGNQKSRYWACVVLAEMGPAAKAAVPELTKVVEDPDPEERMQALIALGEIGPGAAASVPVISDKLTKKDEQASVRYGAAFALGKIGDKKATPALEEAVKDKDAFLSMISAWALAIINPEDETANIRAIKMLAKGIESDKSFVRSAAVRGLTELQSKRPEAIHALVLALKDPEPDITGNALIGIVGAGSSSVPELSKVLADKDLQIAAVMALGRIGADAKGAVPAIVKQLPGDNPLFQREAHFALGAIGPDAAAAVPALIKALNDKEMEVRYSASYALGKLGPAAKPAVSALKANIKSEDEFLRLASVWALLSIDPTDKGLVETALPLLIAALDDERPLVRREAATALGDLGKQAKSATAALKKTVSVETDPDVKAAAEAALDRIGG